MGAGINRMLCALAAATFVSPQLAAAPAFGAGIAELAPRESPTRRHKRQQRIGGGVMRKYRNKRPAGRPRSHRNMLHVGRRTRRKHRRAKRG